MNDQDDVAQVVGTLMKGMPLLTAKGVELRSWAQANIAVALLREHGGAANEPALRETWKRLSFGHKTEDGLTVVLEHAMELGYAERDGSEFRLTAKTGVATLNDQVVKIWPSFERFLRAQWGDRYDPHLTPQCRDAFAPCLKHMFLHVAQTTLSANGSGQASYDRLAREFDTIARDRNVADAYGYADTMVIWIRTHPKELGPVSTNLLTLVATLRLFHAQNELAKATAQSIKGTRAYLDTNILVQLLCPKTSSWHQTAAQVLDLGQKLGIEFRIFDAYVQETQELIRFTIETLNRAGGRPGWIGRTNQFLQEFAESNVPKKEFVARLEDFRNVLKRRGVEIVHLPTDVREAAAKLTHAMAQCMEANGDFDRPARAIERDAEALHVLDRDQNVEGKPFPGPWLITFDRRLVACESMFRSMNGGNQVAMLTPAWLAGMTAVGAWSGQEMDLAELAAAWVGVGISPAISFTEKQVMTVLSAGFDLPHDAQVLFVRASLRTEVTREAGRRLRRHEMEGIGALIDEMTRHGMEALAKDAHLKDEEIQRLRDKVRRAYRSEKGQEA